MSKWLDTETKALLQPSPPEKLTPPDTGTFTLVLLQKGPDSVRVAHAERALAGEGCVKINLQILEDNDRVVAFYSSLGYSVEKRISMGKLMPENVPAASPMLQ